MLIEVNPSRCTGCTRYVQYYAQGCHGQYVAINCGYCQLRQAVTRPGSRCRCHQEVGRQINRQEDKA